MPRFGSRLFRIILYIVRTSFKHQFGGFSSGFKKMLIDSKSEILSYHAIAGYNPFIEIPRFDIR